MAYTPVHADWQPKPSTATPITDTALEHIEQGIVDAHVSADAALTELAGKANSTDLAAYQPIAGKNSANGYAGLDASGKVAAAQLPTPGSTDTITEGATNLYFTSPRAVAAVQPSLDSKAVAADPLGFGQIWTVDPRIYSSTTVLGSGVSAFSRITGSGAITKVGIIVGVQSGNIDIGVYSNSGVGRNANPNIKRASTGSIACPAAGYQVVALSVVVQPGDWFAIVADNGTAAFGRTSSTVVGLAKGLLGYENAAFPLPGTASPLGINGAFTPILVGVP